MQTVVSVVTVCIILSLLITAYAQTLEESLVEIRTVNVFPETVVGDGWMNLETITYQNLDEFALYQKFNKINSAYPDQSVRVQKEKQKVRNEVVADPVLESPADISSLESVEKNIEEDRSSSTVSAEQASTTQGTAHVDQEGLESVTAEDAPIDTEGENEPETDVQDEVQVENVPASTTAFRRIDRAFSYVVDLITGVLGEEDSEEGTDVSSSTSVQMSTDSPEEAPVSGTIVNESQQTSLELIGAEDAVAASVEAVGVMSTGTIPNGLKATTTPALGSESGEVSGAVEDFLVASSTSQESVVEHNTVVESDTQIETLLPCKENCYPHTITLSGFGLPIFDEKTELSGAQLRVSFAAEHKSTRDELQSLEVRSSIDGGKTWDAAGAILIDGEASNSVNGGYYLFALPDMTDPDILSDLQIKLIYDHDLSELESLYVESAWLEVFVAELPDDTTLIQNEILMDNNFYDGLLTGDELMLPDGEKIAFDHTDENEDETLIIKTDRSEYVGLSKTVTYLNVTNISENEDLFSLQAYFPEGSKGEVTALEEWEPNKIKEVVVPEYRPFVYHCEAGWEYSGEPVTTDLTDLSKLFAQPVASSSQSEPDVVLSEEYPVSSSSVDLLNRATTSAGVSTELDNDVPNETSTVPVEDAIILPEDLISASSSALRNVKDIQLPLALSTILNNLNAENEEATSTSDATAADTLQESENEIVALDEDFEVTNEETYLCRNTNVVRVCDALEGDNTLCRIDSKKVAEHTVTRYEQGWKKTLVADGTVPKPSVLKRIKQMFGFARDQKEVPDNFEAKNHTPGQFAIKPGETRYFKMEITFPPFTKGEFWIEAIGNSEYGLLDPFWSSQWTYRKPIYIDNTGFATTTEQQIFIEIDATETDFWSNVKSDGGDIRFVRETVGNEESWYNTSWSKRLAIDIQSSQIDADLTDFPVYVDLADLGSDFWSNVKSDGGDIRVTASDGVTEMPIDLVSINTGSETGELHFKASSTLSSSSNTRFFVYYDNADASLYAADDTYGAENVWNSNFIFTYHLEEGASGTGNSGLYVDSTSNGYDGDDEVSASGKSGVIGQGQQISGETSGSPGDHILVPSAALNGENELSFEYWVNITDTNRSHSIMNAGANNELILFVNTSDNLQLYNGGSSDTYSPDAQIVGTGWHHMVVVRDANTNTWNFYLNGVQDGEGTKSETMSALSVPADCIGIGFEQDGSCGAVGDTTQNLQGYIDEFRVHNTVLSADWVSASFRNQATTTDFYATSTPETFTTSSFTELDYWVQHFDNTADEADIWVQVDALAGNASTTIHLYYGNSLADSTSDEYAPFTYDTPQDLYYVVNPSQTNPIVVYSLIDGNTVSIDGIGTTTLNSGETTSFATYASTSVIRANGPITARSTDDASEPPVPVSFATTTHLITTNRGSEDFYVLPPFATANVSIYEGASGVASDSSTVTAGASDTYNVNLTNNANFGVVESDEPVLLYHNNDSDSYVAYPPTTRDLYGVYSQNYLYGTIGTSASVEIYCSNGSNGTTTSMTRGGEETNDHCGGGANGSQGLGNAIRLTNASHPMGATQEADGDGGESTRFLPTPEFGTRYILPQSAEYVTIVCAPRFGSVDIEVQNASGGLIDSGTCTPSGEHPDALNFTPATAYSGGYQVVATNNVPFYVYYEESSRNDETNTWSAVQAKKYRSLYLTNTIGAQEINQDAQYEQNNFRWYQNINAITPTTGWDLGEDGLAAEGDPIIDQGAVNAGDQLRLRINLIANNATGTVDSTSFMLQYAESDSCSAVVTSAWVPIGDPGSTTAVFAGYNNASVSDGAALPSTLLSDSDVAGSYEEKNVSATLPNEVGVGEAIEFDWALTPVAITANTEYCFRMVRSSGEELITYTSYPQVLSAGPPEQPSLFERFDNEHATSTSPTLEFVAVDLGGDDLEYQLQLGTDNTFSSTLLNVDSDANFDFENIIDPANKSPFNNGQRIRYSVPSTLSNGTTYYWRVRAIDPDGSNTYGPWSEIYSFTINTGNTVSEWFQTTDEQFETNSLTSATTSSDAVTLNIAGSNVIGEYGSIALVNGATSTVNLDNSYTNPVVVASIRYPRSIASPNQPALRVFNKTATSFEVLADNFSFNSTGTSTADYVVMEAGDWLLDDGANGIRVYATSTSVSAIAGNTIPSDPGGLDIVFPTSFSGEPAVLTMVTTNNDPQWVVSSVYDGNNITNEPTASQVSLYLNDNLDSDGHGSAEDIDVIAFDQGLGTTNGVPFEIFNTGVDGGGAYVDNTPDTFNFTQSFGNAPGVVAVQQLTMNGAQGGYAQVDNDTPPTASDVTISIEEGGSGADRTHADESVAIVAFENATGTLIRSGNGQVVSTVIDFDDADVGNAWGTIDWTSSGDVTITVQYQTGSGFQDIPDSVLAGNSSGFTSGPINILSLDTDTYNELRLIADLSGVNPQLYDWTVTWGQRVEIPELGDPFDNEKTADDTPTFDFYSTDPQGDDLEYEISYSTDPDFSTGSTTVNSSSTPLNFANQSTPLDTGPFNSGDIITYTVPGGSELTDTETYWWRVRAKDPSGGDAWSPWSEPDSFTVDSGTLVSSWYQTTQAQFEEGELDGLIASTSDAVELSENIGEYGSTTVSGNTWQTINTDRTYNNMVVVASPRYAFNGSDNGRTVQVRNKTANSFEIKAENYTKSLSGSTDINYIVMEAGDWLIDDGGTGLRVVAGTASNVSVVNGSNISYTAGTNITPSPAMSGTPAGLATVSSGNGTEWVSARIDDGTQAGEITSSNVFVSLGVSLDSSTSRTPEDIDYLIYEEGTGTNNSVLFDAFNTGNVVTESETESTVNFNQTFSTAPATIVVQNNGMNGGDGGSALVDTDGVTTNTQVYLSIAEHGASAGNHATEVVSVFAFEDPEGSIRRLGASGGALSGTIASEEVLFSDGLGPKFDRALFSATTPGNSTTSLQIQYQTATGSWALLPDSQVSGNSAGFVSSPIDLTGINIVTYPVIRLYATLTCDGANCPSLDDWTVEWSEGVPLTGNLKMSDRLTNIANATVTAYVNGVDTNRDGVTDVNGNFSLSSITAFEGDVVTVFVDDVPDSNEAVGVFVYDGLGDMTGVQLFEQHLTFASDEAATTTLWKLGQGDNGAIGDEDVFFEVDGNNDLQLCAVGSCASASLYVGATNTLVFATSTNENVSVHDFINYGRIELDSNTIRVSGSWSNSGTITTDTSSVVFTATSTTETIVDGSSVQPFYNVTFGETSGSATWQLTDPLDVGNNLAVNWGTLDRDGFTVNIAGALATGANGFWYGTATTTFDGGGTKTWSDANPIKQNVGAVVIDGTARTVTLASDVFAESIRIGANDTLNGGGAFTINVGGDFTNTNIFLPQSTRLAIVGTSTNALVTLNGSNLYTFKASTTGAGAVSFAEGSITVLNDFEIATGTVTMPATKTTIGGSFSNTGGVFAHNNAEVDFSGAGSETIALLGGPFFNAFYDVVFSGSGSWSFVDTNATTSNTFTITDGTVTLPSGQLSVRRDFSTSGSGAFNANGGEVLLYIVADDQVTSNGSSFHDLRIIEGAPVREGGYDEAWLYRGMITVNASAIDDDLTNFPVYLDLSDFGASFFANLNSDGGDIRITASDGVTEVPREVVFASTTAQTGEVYFLAPSLSSTTDTTFYIYYGNSGASDYAINDTYGAENVWDSDFIAVYHMQEMDPVDSTSYDHDTVAVGDTPAIATGRFGNAVRIIDNGGSDYLDLQDNLNELAGQSGMTISAWANVTDDTNDDSIFARGGSGTAELVWDNISGSTNNDTWTFNVDNTGTGGNRVDAAPTGISVGDTWQYVTGAMQGTNRYIYVDGQLRNTNSGGVTTIRSNTGGTYIGFWAGSGGFDYDGLIDEYRISRIERDAAWIAAEYRNMATSTDFYTLAAGGATTTRVFANSSMTATGNVVIESGQAQFPSTNLNIGGSFDNNGEFVAGSGAVTFNATTSGHTIAPGNSSFYTLNINGNGGSWNVTENATATNAIALTNGDLFTVNSGITLESTGSFTNAMANASTTWTGSTLKLSAGTDLTLNSKTHGGDDYATLAAVNDTIVRMWNSTAGTYTTIASSSIYSQDHAGADGDLFIFGDYLRNSGTEYWTHDTDFDGVALGTSTRQVDVRVANGGFVRASSSLLRITGSSTASTTIDAQSGSFTLRADYATVTAQYFEITGTNANGFQLLSSTTVTLLDNALFTIPAASAAISVDASTVDTNPAAQFFNTNFVTGGGSVNVDLLSAPASYWWFREGSGNRYGEDYDNGDGNPGSIRWDDSNYQINVSGTVFADDGASALGGPTCDGAANNVRIVVDNGAYTDAVPCSGLDGSYSFSNVSYQGDPTIVVYLDTDGGVNGSVITRTPTTDIIDLNIYANRVMTRHEDSAPMTIAKMAAGYDEISDSDLRFIAATGTPNTLTVRPDTELLIASSTTFVPGGNITLQSGGTGNTYDGSFHVDDGAVFTAGDVEDHQIGGSLFVDPGATFTTGSSTYTFTATTSGKTITASSTLTFNTVDFTGVGGAWHVNTDILMLSDLQVAAGTLTGTSDITFENGAFYGNGLVSLGGGTVLLDKSSTLGGTQGWTFNNLTLGDGIVMGTTTPAGVATTTVLGVLTISAGHVLDAGGSQWNLAGTGAAFVEDGVFLEDTSRVTYSGAGAATVLSTNYYDLVLAGDAGSPNYVFGSTGLRILNDLTVAGLVSSVATLNTNDPVLQVDGNVYISPNGVFVASDSAPLTVLGSWNNDGTFTSNNGAVVFDSSDAFTVSAGTSSFGDVLVRGVGTAQILENATSTGTWTLASSSDFVVNPGVTLAVGSTFSNEAGGAATTWTDSTLYLFGGDYELNASTTNDSYATLIVGPSAEVRMWNSDAATTSVIGSLYSMDHAGVDGDLYVYGVYTNETRADYWSYATDFDGTDLTGGGERKVDVYIASSSSLTYTGGSITAVGTSGASTTVQNQGVGTYGFVASGTAAIDWQQVVVRDLDSNGVTFGGSVVVTDFSSTDHLAQIDGATTITVYGSAIDQNPGQNFNNTIFNSDTGVTGALNVRLVGSTGSGWRYTGHSGNLDGESFDLDSGNPGEIIWDDSDPIFSISGNVYQSDRASVSSVCDDITPNIFLAIDGSTVQNASTTCSAADGSYAITDISFDSNDTLTVFIDGETVDGVTVTVDSVGSISTLDIYESHVIVRNAGANPITIADLDAFDSAQDSDIPFTTTVGPNTLTLDPDTTLLVWSNRTFEPGGNITTGGGTGNALDGTVELLDSADLVLAAGENHSFGGNLTLGSGATFDPDQSAVSFTSSGSGRTIDTNEGGFYDLTMSGIGTFVFQDTVLTVANDFVLSNAVVTLPSGTTTVGGSLTTTGGAFDANLGVMVFTSSAVETVSANGSNFNALVFNGSGSWSMTDANATTTSYFNVATGTVTLPSGRLAVGGDFVNTDTLTHNSGVVYMMSTTTDTILTLNGNDLYTLIIGGAATTTMTDASAALLGDLLVASGTLVASPTTLSIGGSLDAAGGVMDTGTGTVLFNSSDAGESVNPGTNQFYNVVFGGVGGGWTMVSATTTNNFTLSNANSFVLGAGEVLYVGGVFTNAVGGAATTWTDTTLILDGANTYAINAKTTGDDTYGTLVLGVDSDIRMWNSSAATVTVASTSSLYSQDHGGGDGALTIYGDFLIGTSTEYWSYATDFDGTSLGGGSRAVTVSLAPFSTTSVTGTGYLSMIGGVGATTTVQSQDASAYAFIVDGGTIDFDYYAFRHLNGDGILFSGAPTISSLSRGDFALSVNGGSLITLASTTLNANPSLLITDTRFATTGSAVSGLNVNLDATTTNSWTFRDHYGGIDGESYDQDGITNCGSIRWDDSSCLITEQTNYRWRYDNGGLGVPDSEWLNTSWTKRQRIRFANNDNQTYTNAAFEVTIPYDADMQSDFEDLRFTDSSGTTLIDYWIEKYTPSSEATVWVQVPSLPASETATVFMYYGNGGAVGVSSSTAVFTAIDDFEDNDVSEYSGQTASFQTGVTYVYGGSYSLEAVTPSSFSNGGMARFDQTVSQGDMIRYRQYIASPSGSSDELCTLFGVQSPVTNNQNYGVCLELFGTERVSLVENAVRNDTYGGVSVLASSTVNYTASGAGWYEVEIDWQTDNTIAVSVFNPAGTLIATTSAVDATYTSGGYGYTFWTNNGALDSIIARPRVTSDPAVYFGAEQGRSGAAWAAAENTAATVFTVGDTARLRFAIENTGLDITGELISLEFAPKAGAPSCAAVPAGNFNPVPTQSGCGVSGICMSTSTIVANDAVTTDLLTIAENTFTAGRFVEDPSNQTSAINIDQNEYTEVEYALTITPNASDESYCFRVTDDGTAYDAYDQIAELVLQYAPVVTALSLNNGLDIELTPGTTTQIYATGTVTDLNGFADFADATTTIYRSGVGDSCTSDANNCYVTTTNNSCSYTNCSGNSCDVMCSAEFFYFAEPTDIGVYGPETWRALLSVADMSGRVATGSAPSIDLLTLRALSVDETIDYGALAVDTDTGSYNATTTVENIGNDAIDVSIEGTDLSDGGSSAIPVSEQRFATSTFTYSACTICNALATTTTGLEVDLMKPTSTSTPVVDDVYWGLYVPFGVAGTAHQGNNIFYAIGD